MIKSKTKPNNNNRKQYLVPSITIRYIQDAIKHD